MQFLLSMPGGSEWILILLVLGGLIACPILAIYYYSKSKRLEQELQRTIQEKDDLYRRLLDKNG